MYGARVIYGFNLLTNLLFFKSTFWNSAFNVEFLSNLYSYKQMGLGPKLNMHYDTYLLYINYILYYT